MKTFKTLALAAAVSAGVLGASEVMAAPVQGGLGTESVGKFDITFKKDAKAAIWGMRDLPFTKDETKTLNACVYSSTAGVQFQVSTATGNFSLTDGSNTAPFDVTIKSTKTPAHTAKWGAGGLGHEDISPVNFNVTGATEPTPDDGSPITSVCTGDDQTIDIDVSLTGTASLVDGEYTETITLTVEPT